MKSLTLTLFFGLFLFSTLTAQHHDSNRAMLGIYANKISEKKSQKLNFEQERGFYVTEVLMNSAAEEAGLKPFDYIYYIAGKNLESYHSIREVLSDYQPGDTTTLYFLRNGNREVRNVKLVNEADTERRKRSDSEDPFLGVGANHDRVPSDINGVRVDVIENTTADAMGLQDDDIITRVNGYPTLDWHDLGTAIDALEVGEEIAVDFIRDGGSNTLKSPIQSLAASKDHDNQEEVEQEETPVIVATNLNDTETNSGSTYVAEMEDMEVEMENVEEEEAQEMKEKVGVDMPVVQNLEIDRLNIFPNPNEGMFNIRFSLPNTGDTAIRVFNANGQLVYANDLMSFSGDFNGRIDLTTNPAGTYFLMVQQGDYSVSKRVAVVRR